MINDSNEHINTPHTPKAHKKHIEGECGCWTGDGECIYCKYCGAAYVLFEVMEFPSWMCYDCNAQIEWRSVILKKGKNK